MAIDPSVKIDIAAEFTGKKAFDKAENSATKLEGTVKNLGKTLAIAFSAKAVYNFGAAAVKAFADGEKSAALLANTLTNLGFGMATKSVEAFISQLQLATGVSDQELRPAMAKLVQALGSVTAAQDALSLAMDISAGSGTDLNTVVNDLAAAQLGNYKGLKKYNLGLTQLQLKTMSAAEIMAKFNEVFGGSAAVAADTFAGKLARIQTALEKAKGSIGEGIIDALMIATGSQDIEALQQKIIDFGTSAGQAISRLGEVVHNFMPVIKGVAVAFAALWTVAKIQSGVAAVIKILDGINKAMKILRGTAIATAIAEAFVLNPLGGVAVAAGIIATLAAVGVAVKALDGEFGALNDSANAFFEQTKAGRIGERFTLENWKKSQAEAAKLAAQEKANAEALAKAEADAAAERAKVAKEEAAARQKDLLARQKLAKQEAAARKQAENIKKAAANFDLTKIQIAAALKATYDKDERLRLLALQAIENDTGDAALNYINQLDLLTKEQQTNKLNGIKTISETELNYINQLLLDELQRIKMTQSTEEEAAAARQAAYAKYNAAIAQSGGLADANFYSEKTQVELLQIAKLASLDNVAAAQATYDTLNYTTQTDIIKRIAAEQAKADAAKLASLKEYLALLSTPVTMPSSGGGGSQAPRFGVGGQPLYDQNGGYLYSDYVSPTGSGSANIDNSTTINIEGMIDTGNFDEIVNQSFLRNQRVGYSQYVAGSLP